jgi:SAM-dependent methyltransferase
MTSEGGRVSAGVGPAGSWAADDFVDRWIAADSLAAALELPRRISAALVAQSGIEVRRVVDVGSGTGTFLRTLLEAFPEAEGVWVDASLAMRDRAVTSLADLGSRVTFALGDLREPDAIPLEGDVVVSARAAHHLDAGSIERLYRAVATALSPGGFLCNLDHIAAPGDWRARYRQIRPLFVGGGGGAPHEHDAPPLPLDRHLAWLREAGFQDPDVPWRLFWTALVVARTPSR